MVLLVTHSFLMLRESLISGVNELNYLIKLLNKPTSLTAHQSSRYKFIVQTLKPVKVALVNNPIFHD